MPRPSDSTAGEPCDPVAELLADLPDDATLSEIRPLRRDPNQRELIVAGRRLATLPASTVERLELAVGQSWDAQRARQVAEALELERARRIALTALGRRALARGELVERITRRGHDARIAELVAGELVEDGWLDDRAYGESVCRELLRKGPAGQALLEQRLLQRRLDPDMVTEIAKAALDDADPLESAVTLARARMQSSSRLGPAALLRRVCASLARRGFDEETIAAAVDKLGLCPDPTDDLNEEPPS